MSGLKVLITNPEVPQVAIDLLDQKCTLIINEETPYPTREQILAKCPGVDAIFWASHEKLDAEVLDTAGPQMKVVGVMSAGLDNVDVETLKARGIKLGNTPVVLNDAVADVAVLLALGASRRITEGRRAIERGTWRFGIQWQLGRDIAASTVGIVGLGGIGQAIVTKLARFGVSRFLYSGHKEKEEGKPLNAKFVTFDELIKESDFVIISCPLTVETRGMFNKNVFDKMKDTAILVNIARGAIVVQDDLVEALEKKKIFAAGLDVMTPEPLPVDHPLLKLDNVVLLPHIGSATINTRAAMAQLTAQNI
ncbi:hypothetical protein AMK59_7800, partial [Oryctes borbonicus]